MVDIGLVFGNTDVHLKKYRSFHWRLYILLEKDTHQIITQIKETRNDATCKAERENSEKM